MKRRDFVAAGLAGLGAVGVSASSMASTRPSGTVPTTRDEFRAWRGVSSEQEWDGTVRADQDGSQAVDDARVALAAELTALVAPLRGGSQLAESTLLEVFVDEWGSGVAIVEHAGGRIARLDICRRQGDPGVTPLAATVGYEVYVRNGAEGARETDRETILAARSLADVIGSNEGGSQLALVSKREYWRSEHWG